MTFSSSQWRAIGGFFMTKFNIVNIYKHKSYFSRLMSVKPIQALKLHSLLMDRMNNVSQNRNQNRIKATPVDDAAVLGISKSTYQKYKKALLKAKIWIYDPKFKNNHRIAGDWHISEDLLDDPFSVVSSEETSKNADVPSDEKDSKSKKDDKKKKLVSPDKTRKEENDDAAVSSEETSKNADKSSKSEALENKQESPNGSLVSPDKTSLVSSPETNIYSIIDNINKIDDDDINNVFHFLEKDGYAFSYYGKVLEKQKLTLKSSLNKLNSKDRKQIFDKLFYTTNKPTKDTLNWLIRCTKNKLKQNTSQPRYRSRAKRVEQGTDWSKKKANTNSGLSTDQLREIYAGLK